MSDDEQEMIDQSKPKPKARPAQVDRVTRIIVLALAILSAFFTIALLGSFSGGGRSKSFFHRN
jgi:hypothetical protein